MTVNASAASGLNRARNQPITNWTQSTIRLAEAAESLNILACSRETILHQYTVERLSGLNDNGMLL